jgi:hypothetical protein
MRGSHMNRPAQPRWRRVYQRPGRGIPLNRSGPSQPSASWLSGCSRCCSAWLAITVVAVPQYRTGRGPVVVAWLAAGPLLAPSALQRQLEIQARPRVAVLGNRGTLWRTPMSRDAPRRPANCHD